MSLIYNPNDLNDDYYNRIKDAGDIELEHQIGRITNYKKILSEINQEKTSGDIIEFGTFQGFSLLWIAHLNERLGMFNKKIVGLDGFVGLPNSEGGFFKGQFNDTSIKKTKNNLKYNKDLYEITKHNIKIEKFLYSEDRKILERLEQLKTKKFCFIHIDCDISSSVREIFMILKAGDLMSNKCYILFDDYGCVDSYAKTVDAIMEELKSNWSVSIHSSTKLTKNFLLKKYE